MVELNYENCENCIISHASGFGRAAIKGVPTCKLYRTNYTDNGLRGTYQTCEFVQYKNLCEYKPIEHGN